jgi:hypothetical protein
VSVQVLDGASDAWNEATQALATALKTMVTELRAARELTSAPHDTVRVTSLPGATETVTLRTTPVRCTDSAQVPPNVPSWVRADEAVVVVVVTGTVVGTVVGTGNEVVVVAIPTEGRATRCGSELGWLTATRRWSCGGACSVG